MSCGLSVIEEYATFYITLPSASKLSRGGCVRESFILGFGKVGQADVGLI